MLDYVDASDSALRLVLLKALRSYDDDQIFIWLEDDEPILRAAAARELHLRASTRNFERLVELCRSKRYESREAAAFALGQFGTPNYPFAEQSFAVLATLLDDDYFEVQCAAIHAIGRLARVEEQPSRKLQKSVLDLATHERSVVRETVAFALLSIRHKLVDAVLARLLGDADPGVRDAAEFCTEARRELQEVGVPA